MARCNNCGERLFPTDTFCGLCGATVEGAIAKGQALAGPKPLVGEGSISKAEREILDAKRRDLAKKVEEKRRFEQEKKFALERQKEREARAAERQKKAEAKPADKAVAPEAKKVVAAPVVEKVKPATVFEEVAAKTNEPKLASKPVFTTSEITKEVVEKPVEKAVASEPVEEAIKIFEKVPEAAEEKIEAFEEEIEELEESAEEEFVEEEITEEELDEEELEEIEASEKEEKSEKDDELAKGETMFRLSEELRMAIEEADRLEAESIKAEAEAKIAEEEAVKAKARAAILNSDFSEKEKFVPKKVTKTSSVDYQLGSDRRAREEQREYDKVIRRKKIEKKNTVNPKDIVVLLIGVAILVALLFFLLLYEPNKKGNDSYKGNGATPTVSVSEATDDPAPNSNAEIGKTWTGDVAESFAKGEGSATTPFLIHNGEELAYLAKEVNAGNNFAGKFFRLEADIDLGGVNWTPIGYLYAAAEGDMTCSFNGNFDGNNHTIKGLSIKSLDSTASFSQKSENEVVGLFGVIVTSKIENLIIENAAVELNLSGNGDIAAGVLVGESYKSQISGVKVNGSINITGANKVSEGIVSGIVADSTFDEVEISGDVKGSSSNESDSLLCGLFAGKVENTTVTKLVANGAISGETNSTYYCGLVAGYAKGINLSDSDINGIINGKVSAANASTMIGGLIGSGAGCEDHNTKVNSQIDAKTSGNTYVGGAYGYALESLEEKANITGTVKAATSAEEAYTLVGGSVGYAEKSQIKDSTIDTQIDSTANSSNSTGGIAGKVNSSDISNITVKIDSVVHANDEQSGVAFAGAAFGDATAGNTGDIICSGHITVESQYDGYAGGIAGLISGGAFTNVNCTETVIDNNSVSGSVSGGYAGFSDGKESFTECLGAKERNNTGKNIYDEESVAITETN